eukprot:345220-Amphidinium_carterae.1
MAMNGVWLSEDSSKPRSSRTDFRDFTSSLPCRLTLALAIMVNDDSYESGSTTSSILARSRFLMLLIMTCATQVATDIMQPQRQTDLFC